jgi:signal transduction histidine kinase/ActR/RegA family two-component response regulator
MLESHFQPSLVLASIVVAIAASFAALSLAGRISTAAGGARRWWLASGAGAMGIGIWSMHFVGMLAFQLPIPLGYDLGITLVSLALPIAVSALALWQVSQPTLSTRRLLHGALLMGAGINAMHYTGMAALRMSPPIRYDPLLFALSVLIAVAASGAALWIAYRLRTPGPRVWQARGLAAVVMGLAIAGMHYTGMAAAGFPGDSICLAAGTGFSQNTLAIMVISTTAGVLAVAILASAYDAQLETRAQLLALSEMNTRATQALLEREREARQQAEQVNILKDEFLAMISHELRTPLNAAVGWSQVLRRPDLDPGTSQKALETIERNALIQARLIDELLDVGAIISGKVTLEPDMIVPATLVREAVEAALPAAHAKGVALACTTAPDVPVIRADLRRLRQVLANLLSNAVKFTDAGGHVEVAAARAGASVRITVGDSGIGIDPDFLPFVFERFRQEDASITRRYGGLGLGLSIVRSLVELHGGTISVESAGTGRGATFSVTLPVGWSPDGDLPAATGPATGDSAKTERLDGLRVLVLDDVADALALLEHTLSAAGATVIATPSARAALAQIALVRPDVIVSDIGMPDMDGFAFMRQVRATTHQAPIPALALTAFTRPADHQRALDAGFAHFMEKPFTQQGLVAAVARLARERADAQVD